MAAPAARHRRPKSLSHIEMASASLSVRKGAMRALPPLGSLSDDEGHLFDSRRGHGLFDEEDNGDEGKGYWEGKRGGSHLTSLSVTSEREHDGIDGGEEEEDDDDDEEDYGRGEAAKLDEKLTVEELSSVSPTTTVMVSDGESHSNRARALPSGGKGGASASGTHRSAALNATGERTVKASSPSLPSFNPSPNKAGSSGTPVARTSTAVTSKGSNKGTPPRGSSSSGEMGGKSTEAAKRRLSSSGGTDIATSTSSSNNASTTPSKITTTTTTEAAAAAAVETAASPITTSTTTTTSTRAGSRHRFNGSSGDDATTTPNTTAASTTASTGPSSRKAPNMVTGERAIKPLPPLTSGNFTPSMSPESLTGPPQVSGEVVGTVEAKKGTIDSGSYGQVVVDSLPSSSLATRPSKGSTTVTADESSSLATRPSNGNTHVATDESSSLATRPSNGSTTVTTDESSSLATRPSNGSTIVAADASSSLATRPSNGSTKMAADESSSLATRPSNGNTHVATDESSSLATRPSNGSTTVTTDESSSMATRPRNGSTTVTTDESSSLATRPSNGSTNVTTDESSSLATRPIMGSTTDEGLSTTTASGGVLLAPPAPTLSPVSSSSSSGPLPSGPSSEKATSDGVGGASGAVKSHLGDKGTGNSVGGEGERANLSSFPLTAGGAGAGESGAGRDEKFTSPDSGEGRQTGVQVDSLYGALPIKDSGSQVESLPRASDSNGGSGKTKEPLGPVAADSERSARGLVTSPSASNVVPGLSSGSDEPVGQLTPSPSSLSPLPPIRTNKAG